MSWKLCTPDPSQRRRVSWMLLGQLDAVVGGGRGAEALAAVAGDEVVGGSRQARPSSAVSMMNSRSSPRASAKRPEMWKGRSAMAFSSLSRAMTVEVAVAFEFNRLNVSRILGSLTDLRT
ncbi:hypothetical protein [Streptomyces sp. NPDC093261]|uniref:hypothetical protein n=1 Tax=Streptomyces sp. NPDC093261 TaxID=3366037 RepID=UPI0037FB0AEB